MQFFILFVALFIGEAFVTSHAASNYEESRLACIEELKITGDDLTIVNDFNFNVPPMPACFMKCLIAKMGYYQDGVGFVIENVTGKVSADVENVNIEKVRAAIMTCIDEFKSETEECLQTVKVFRCFDGKAAKARVDGSWTQRI